VLSFICGRVAARRWVGLQPLIKRSAISCWP